MREGRIFDPVMVTSRWMAFLLLFKRERWACDAWGVPVVGYKMWRHHLYVTWAWRRPTPTPEEK